MVSLAYLVIYSADSITIPPPPLYKAIKHGNYNETVESNGGDMKRVDEVGCALKTERVRDEKKEKKMFETE